jgi:hypothetical protein
MNGTLYTYINKNDRIKLSYDFRITREKSTEIETFLDYYCDQEMRLIDHNDVSYRGYITNYPFEFSRQFIKNETTLRLEFEGSKL